MKCIPAIGMTVKEAPRPPEISPQPPQPAPKRTNTKTYIAAGLIIVFLVVVGAVASQFIGTPYSPTGPTKSINHIDYFLVQEEGQILKVQFALKSKDLSFLSSDGTVLFEICDEATNETLYKTEFIIHRGDFKYYETLLGKEVLGYVWTISLSNVEKGFSYGNARLVFTTPDKRSFSDTDEYVTVPEYTEEEATQMFEAKYAASATLVDKVLVTEDFEITVENMGMFSRYTYNDFEREFRIDLKVRNMGGGTKSFNVYGTCVVTTTGLQCEISFYGTFEGGDISAGATKQGYLLFDDVLETANIARLVINEIYIFDFEKDEAYTLVEMYENRYLQSAISVQQTITKEDFSITLVRVGHFTHREYDTWGDEVTEFRVDLEVTSIANESEYLFASNIVVLDNLHNQYDYTYGGTLELGEIYPRVTREGYVLFPTIDENADRITVIVTDTGYPEDIVYEFTVDL